MTLLKLKEAKLKDYLRIEGVDVDYVLLKKSDTIKYMVSEFYSPPPEEVSVHRIVVDLNIDSVELYLSPLDFYRARELFQSDGVELYAVLSTCIDVPEDMRCIEREAMDSIIISRTAKTSSRAVIASDDTSICENEDITCVDIRNLLKRIRRSKYEEEVALIKRAVEISEQALELAAPEIKPGLSELEIASLVESTARRLGAEGFAFSTIVAVGENTAKPHHIPTTRKFSGSEPILIDFGVRVSGYVADITKVFISSRVDNNYENILEVVKSASRTAISAMKAGVNCSKIDDVAREELKKHGLHKYFLHGVGHGLGIDVHEPPRLARNSKETLMVGDVVTVEPGVYIHGRYGARLEVDVYIGEAGVNVLSTKPTVIRL